MKQSRRQFLATTAATAGVVTLLPYAAQAAAHGGNMFPVSGGEVKVHPVDHASFVMETPAGVIYCDPVGDVANYSDFATPDLILITPQFEAARPWLEKIAPVKSMAIYRPDSNPLLTAAEVTAAAGMTYSMENVRFTIDCYSVAGGFYEAMLEQRLQEAPIAIHYLESIPSIG